MLQPGWETEGGMPYLDRGFREVNLEAFTAIDRRIRALVDGLMVQRVVTHAPLQASHEFIWEHVLRPLKKD